MQRERRAKIADMLHRSVSQVSKQYESRHKAANMNAAIVRTSSGEPKVSMFVPLK